MGTTQVECSATDAAGNQTTGTFNVTVQDTTAPALSNVPADISETATSSSGATATYTAPTASDIVDGSVDVDCSPASGSTFPLGTTQVECSTTDAAGNVGRASFNVKVLYDYAGFFSPVDNPGADNDVFNKAKAGSAIPVKFSLGGDMGLDIFYTETKPDGTTVSYPRSTSMPCDSTASIDAIEQTGTAGSSGLSYDEATGQYTYVWKTSKDSAGSCRQLVVKLKDGTEHRAFFKLIKP